ncbi:hypothetical protein F7731_01760 [Cytobacillus depressus]|uniref:Uncharacterized protein n=1 Tax=Cytobacillus depressus TaxID=1602942 RepID=A0A6L3VGD5_9BACI|nr:hypothetical protein [Cytobacillus depressus]KAB2338315.1 hypothetical protein F7731_01760 [Cytobacillus depressus]
MTYIIENANILKEKQIIKASILVDNGIILSIRPAFKRYRYMKMNAEPFIMTPAPILYEQEFPSEKTFQELKAYFIEEFILKGCTAFLTVVKIKHEYELSHELKRLKTQLLNSPIDYIIGVRIPVRLLTQSFVRKCKRENIPAIFVEVDQVDELNHIPWGWLRDAMFPYNSPLIPIFLHANERDKSHAEKEWNRVMETEKMPYVKDELLEKEPISHSTLSKIGVYPFKASIHQGCELSYNLYLKSREFRKIEEEQLFHYHRNKLVVTVHKGDVIRAGEKLFFRPGSGEHVKINTPSFFKIEV